MSISVGTESQIRGVGIGTLAVEVETNALALPEEAEHRPFETSGSQENFRSVIVAYD
jgi:hypothetical protein